MGPPEDENEADRDGDQGRLSWASVLFSAVAAAFGVQSKRNRERDFSRGNALAFIAAGLFVTVLFVAAVMTVVSMVLAGR